MDNTASSAASSVLVEAVVNFTDRDLRDLTGHEAVDRLTELTTALALLSADRLTTLQVIADSGVWSGDGSRSVAAWLSRAERSSKAAAGSDLKLARLLAAHLPRTSQALRDGVLPVAHARAISRTVLRTQAMKDMLTCPDRGETFLLDQAGLELEDFKRFLNAWCHRVDPDAADQNYRDAAEGFTFTLAQTTEGAIPGGFLSPLAAEGLSVALLAEIGIPATGDTRTHPQRMHDALASLAARALDGGGLGRHASVRPQVVVHVPLATLEAKAGTRGLAPAWLQESKTPIPRPVLDKMLCDSELIRTIFGPDSEVLDIGRAQRTFTGPRRRALDARDGGCRWPGCHAPPAQSEGHHQTLWSQGGRTDPREGLLLCWHHHDYTHANGIAITGDPSGTLTYTDRHGRLIGTSTPRHGPDPDQLPWDDAA